MTNLRFTNLLGENAAFKLTNTKRVKTNNCILNCIYVMKMTY